MNIFFLDRDPELCAKAHYDKHVVKMILEYAQLLSTAHHVLGSDVNPECIYKEAYKNHPCAIWVRQSPRNYYWLVGLWLNLLKEYYFRYGKIHASSALTKYLKVIPDYHPQQNITSNSTCLRTQGRFLSSLDFT